MEEPVGIESPEGASRQCLWISTPRQLRIFDDRFGALLSDDPVIDWAAVAEAYGGAVIAPHLPECRRLVEWYQGWDVGSGCFWDVGLVRILGPSRRVERV